MNLNWVPSAANLAEALTKIIKTPVKVANGSKYRNGTLRPGVEYIQLHNKFLGGNCFYKVKEGKAEYRYLLLENLVTCGLEDKVQKRGQDKKKIMKELMEEKNNDTQIVSIGCLHCDGMIGECMEAQEMINQIYPETPQDIIRENLWILDAYDRDMDESTIGQMTTQSMKKRKQETCNCISNREKCDHCLEKGRNFDPYSTPCGKNV